MIKASACNTTKCPKLSNPGNLTIFQVSSSMMRIPIIYFVDGFSTAIIWHTRMQISGVIYLVHTALTPTILAMREHADEKLPDPQGALTRDLPLSAISSIN